MSILTEQEWFSIQNRIQHEPEGFTPERFARAIEAAVLAKLREGVEPVAWMHLAENGNIRMWSKSSPESIEAAIGCKPIPLFTHPSEDAQDARLRDICKLIADDGYAVSFQTFGQYRTALLKAVDAMQGASKC